MKRQIFGALRRREGEKKSPLPAPPPPPPPPITSMLVTTTYQYLACIISNLPPPPPLRNPGSAPGYTNIFFRNPKIAILSFSLEFFSFFFVLFFLCLKTFFCFLAIYFFLFRSITASNISSWIHYVFVFSCFFLPLFLFHLSSFCQIIFLSQNCSVAADEGVLHSVFLIGRNE